jgi:tRNA (guanine-N7-)-methyltransferase
MQNNYVKKRLYGRRKGPKLSAHQQHLLDDLLPKFELHLKHSADPRSYFSPPPCGEVENSQAQRSGFSGGGIAFNDRPPPGSLRSPTSPQGGGDIAVADVWLEIGFGGGEHLIWQAQHHPNIGFIGAEPYVNGVVKLLSHLKAAQTSNIRIYTGDARDVLEALPDASIGRVFILFPDPWPKTRHHKRRFVRMKLLDTLARVMKTGAELRFASDDAGYVEWTLERLLAHRAFVWTATRASDWSTRPADWPPTRYEAKQLHGKPVFLRFVRH